MRTLVIIAFSLVLTGSQSYRPYFYYVDVAYESREQIEKLREQGYDIGGVDLERNVVTLVVTPGELRDQTSLPVNSVRPVSLRPDPQYKKPKDVRDFLYEVEENYPHLAAVETIGTTSEGRDILAVNLTARFFMPGSEKKKAVLFDSMHHAREVMSPEITLDIVDYLTSRYDSDPKVRKWMNYNSIWVVPMVNPDGNHKVWSQSSMWRKNNRGGYGVDNNRNYPFDWNSCNGSSGNRWSDTYRGPSAASEPETKALMTLAARIKPMFNISYHSFSEIVIFPYGCSPKRIPSPDRAIYEQVAQELAGKLRRDSGSGTYRAGTSYDLLYDVDGGSLDWMYAEHKIMSFVVEINSSSLGFQPSYRRWRDTTVERHRAGWQYILDRMEGPGIR